MYGDTVFAKEVKKLIASVKESGGIRQYQRDIFTLLFLCIRSKADQGNFVEAWKDLRTFSTCMVLLYNRTSDLFPLNQDLNNQHLQASCSELADLQLYSTKHTK